MKMNWIVLILYLTISIKPTPIAPVNLTVVNKSGMDIAIQLDGAIMGESYYLRMPMGDRKNPTEATYSIQRDDYTLQLYYLEYYDPVYGTKCSESSSIWYSLRSQRTLTILPCDERIPNRGENTIKKIGGETSVGGGPP